ncbi:FliA/WhiG family RNA polymerase sigma factor [Pseudalkalibacillus salsuginis]|uniref:FliA/WhiG family RNA polymerase sigma factor n=1 Tax=Pseudalkalibacillus salsuginis TaxID=2910972 RepID=UPI001F457292|nr:FliA/WhiG family RNA polymerase sigma factor [Pseudalkalibacillus salsuginis]MCF6410592.1 FliA/WhiG family RNA polymerase sigma factor [Pseudalkalibacillus salsuginis]
MRRGATSESSVHWDNWSKFRDKDSCEALLEMHLPLVQYHVQRIAVGLPKNINKDELRSNGLLGLYDALKKFDPTRDLKFDTYASFRIRGAILDGLRREDWLPRSMREKTKKIELTIERMEQEQMRSVSAAEVAVEVGMSEEEVLTIMSESFLANVLSIDEENKDSDSNEKVGYTIEDKKVDTPETLMLTNELHKHLASIIEELNEKEQLVVSLFYYEELTLTEIGQVLNLSTSRISQIHSKALYKLKNVLTKYTN